MLKFGIESVMDPDLDWLGPNCRYPICREAHDTNYFIYGRLPYLVEIKKKLDSFFLSYLATFLGLPSNPITFFTMNKHEAYSEEIIIMPAYNPFT